MRWVRFLLLQPLVLVGVAAGVAPKTWANELLPACRLDRVIHELAEADAHLRAIENRVYSGPRTTPSDMEEKLVQNRHDLERLTDEALDAELSEENIQRLEQQAASHRTEIQKIERALQAGESVGAANTIRPPSSIPRIDELQSFADLQADHVYAIVTPDRGTLKIRFEPRLLSQLQNLDSALRRYIWSALQKGPVAGAQGSNGIKRITSVSNGVEIKHLKMERRVYGCLTKDGVIEFKLLGDHKTDFARSLKCP